MSSMELEHKDNFQYPSYTFMQTSPFGVLFEILKLHFFLETYLGPACMISRTYTKSIRVELGSSPFQPSENNIKSFIWVGKVLVKRLF